jgi:hypothetical protein
MTVLQYLVTLLAKVKYPSKRLWNGVSRKIKNNVGGGLLPMVVFSVTEYID